MRTFSIGLALLVVGGCSFSELGPVPAGLLGEWHLEAPELAERNPRTLHIEEQQTGGNAGCNHFFGTIEARGGDSGRLQIDVQGTTRIWCGEPIMEAEATYLGSLGRVRNYALDGDRLELTGGGIPTLQFRRVSG